MHCSRYRSLRRTAAAQVIRALLRPPTQGRAAPAAAAALQLGMRIGFGAVFFNSGLLKIRSWGFAVKLFQDEYKLPLLDPVLAAQVTAFVELTVPVFLSLGLATRLATLPLLGMVSVIQTFVYPQAWTEHLLWASILVFLLTRGPGILSLDYAIEASLAKPPERQRHHLT